MNNNSILKNLTARYPKLSSVENEIAQASDSLISCFNDGKKVLVCGNGGSCADSDHIVGELMKGFENKRQLDELMKKKLSGIAGERGEYIAMKLQKGFPAISLTAHSALMTAVANDIDPDLVFAQQVIGYGSIGDVLIAISTSGNSQNIIDACITAQAIGMNVIGLTGEDGGKMKSLCDILINVPEKRTSYVQELHFPVYHSLCLMIETYFFRNE